MDNFDMFESEPPETSLDSIWEYWDLVRLGFIIPAGSLKFSCDSTPAKKENYRDQIVKLSQSLQGYTAPIDCEKLLPKPSFLRQPNANQIFGNKQAHIYFRERERTDTDNRLRPHHLVLNYQRDKDFSFALHWDISDRSLFTRLVALAASNSDLHVAIHIGKKDKFFQDFQPPSPTNLLDVLPVESIAIYQR